MGIRLFLAAAILAALPCAAAVTVTFTGSDRYADAGMYGEETERNLKTLERYFQELAKRYLPADADFRVEVLDVDLAGERRPGGGYTQPRVMRGRADWPVIKLRYTLQAPGKEKASGEETISDPDYLQGRLRAGTSEALPYERLMLDAWFKARFVEGRKPSR